MLKRYAEDYEKHVAAIAEYVRPAAQIIAILLVVEIVMRYHYGASAYWQWLAWGAVVIAGVMRHTTASIILVTCVCIFYVVLVCVMWVASVIEYCAMAVGWRKI
jgi:hypothetical protein